MAEEAVVAILERSLTERLNVHRRELDHMDEQIAGLRDDLTKEIHAMREDQAAMRTLLEANNALINKLVVGIIGAGGTVIASAAMVLVLGPGT